MESTVAKDRATVSVVKSRAELGRAHQELLQLMKLGSDRSDWQTDRYHLLMLVVEDYESKTYRSRKPDPVEMIEFEMDQRGLRQCDLVPYLGSRSRVSEILARKRKLTLKMMRALHAELSLPLEILVQDYELADLE